MSGTTALVAANLLYEMLCVLPGVEYRWLQSWATATLTTPTPKLGGHGEPASPGAQLAVLAQQRQPRPPPVIQMTSLAEADRQPAPGAEVDPVAVGSGRDADRDGLDVGRRDLAGRHDVGAVRRAEVDDGPRARPPSRTSWAWRRDTPVSPSRAISGCSWRLWLVRPISAVDAVKAIVDDDGGGHG